MTHTRNRLPSDGFLHTTTERCFVVHSYNHYTHDYCCHHRRRRRCPRFPRLHQSNSDKIFPFPPYRHLQCFSIPLFSLSFFPCSTTHFKARSLRYPVTASHGHHPAATFAILHSAKKRAELIIFTCQKLTGVRRARPYTDGKRSVLMRPSPQPKPDKKINKLIGSVQ